jgi:hypothetical protein
MKKGEKEKERKREREREREVTCDLVFICLVRFDVHVE